MLLLHDVAWHWMFNGEKMSLFSGRKHFRIIIQSNFDSRIKPVCKGLACHHMVLESSSTQIYFKQKQKQNKLYALTLQKKKICEKKIYTGKSRSVNLRTPPSQRGVCVYISFAMQHARYTSKQHAYNPLLSTLEHWGQCIEACFLQI